MFSSLPKEYSFTRGFWNQSMLSSIITTLIVIIFLSNIQNALPRAWVRRRLTNVFHAAQAIIGFCIFCLLLAQLYIPKECELVIGIYMIGSFLGTACLDGVLLLKAYYANRRWRPMLAIGAALELFRLLAFALTTVTNTVAVSPWNTCITSSVSSFALILRVCADVIQNIFLSFCFILPVLQQSKLWSDAQRVSNHNIPPRLIEVSPPHSPQSNRRSIYSVSPILHLKKRRHYNYNRRNNPVPA
ncbi:hypothetical protein BDF19DRAFT_5376 [Syncephalis fuscata]|nr:hypothetical protein BDF19DRAFT_5376 [Syncephalis fuscata]